jgi:hypothetical protein
MAVAQPRQHRPRVAPRPQGLPNFADITVDVGGYRFQESQKLPADLVWKALELPTTCYDWKCAQACEGVTCYVIKDAYGNNAGYATAIEAMLAKLEAMGAGTQARRRPPVLRPS